MLSNNKINKKVPFVKIKEEKGLITSHSGLYLVGKFCEEVGLFEAFDEYIKVKERDSGYSSSEALMSLIYVFLSGGDALDDIEVIRKSDALKVLLGYESFPHPTTLGRHLRRYTLGHIRQVEKAIKEVRHKVFRDNFFKKITLDFDSSIWKEYGNKDGVRYSYKGIKGYNPLFCFIGETGECLHMRLRGGNVYSSDGAVSFLREVLGKVNAYIIRIRGDSAFYRKDFVDECERKRIIFTITADLTVSLLEKIRSIPSDEWRKVGDYEITEFYYKPTGWDREYRYIVKRERRGRGEQGDLFEGKYKHYAVVTNMFKGSGSLILSSHLKRCTTEKMIGELKSGLGLEPLPLRDFFANWLFLLMGITAFNLLVYIRGFYLPSLYKKHMVKRMRYHFINIPGRVVKNSKGITLYLMKDNVAIFREIYYLITDT